MQEQLEQEVTQLREQVEKLKKKISKIENGRKDQLSMAVVSGDLDKVMASMIIGIAAAAMDTKVKMFFSFWSLSALRDPKKSPKGKDFISKMFGFMLPKGKHALKLSNMNMGGMGSKMINYVMKKKNVDDVETLIANAQKMGVKLVACAMSMDIMGIKQEELIDGVEIAGVASYLAETEDSGLNLFI